MTRILRAAVLAAEQNALVQMVIAVALVYCVVSQWR